MNPEGCSLKIQYYDIFKAKISLFELLYSDLALVSGPALVVVPVVPWNHSIFEKGAMEPLDFLDLVKWNHSIFKFGTVGTTRFKLIAPALIH